MMEEDDDTELTDSENEGGSDSDDEVQDQNNDVVLQTFNTEQAAAMRQQYDRVASTVENFDQNVGQPLSAQMGMAENLGDLVAPAGGDDPDAPQPPPNHQYDAAELQVAPGVPKPAVPQYQNMSDIPLPLGPIGNQYEDAASAVNPPTAGQQAVAAAAGTVVVDINGGNDGAKQTVAKRSLSFTVGLIGCSAVAGSALGVIGTYFLYNKVFGSAANTNGQGGVGPSSTISLSGPLNFDSVNIGVTATQTLTISNVGALPINVTAITLPAGFSGTWTGSIAVGKSQDVKIVFSPTAAQIYSGNIIVTSDAMFGSNTTSVCGLGMVPQAAKAPAIGVTGFLDFGDVPNGQTRFSGLVIHNSGMAPLVITGITTTAGFTASFAGTIMPGDVQQLKVVFTPTAVQSYSGTLTVASNATTGTGTISVSGNGIDTTGDTEKDFEAIADSLVSQWNDQLDEATFWNAAATWASTPTGTPPLLPSYSLQLLVLLYAYNLATHIVPPIVDSNTTIETMAESLISQRKLHGWDNNALYLAAAALTSPDTGVALYRYEKLNVLAQAIGLIIQAATPPDPSDDE